MFKNFRAHKALVPLSDQQPGWLLSRHFRIYRFDTHSQSPEKFRSEAQTQWFTVFIGETSTFSAW